MGVEKESWQCGVRVGIILILSPYHQGDER